MKTLLNSTEREEIIRRINTLSENSTAQWGKMDVYRMVMHCTIWDEWVQGKNKYVYKQEFFGKLFGKTALRNNTKDDSPIKKGIPAGRNAVKSYIGGDLETQKKTWAALTADYANYSNDAFIHDFFGKMTKEQIGIFAYKHADHHLRQFGA